MISAATIISDTYCSSTRYTGYHYFERVVFDGEVKYKFCFKMGREKEK